MKKIQYLMGWALGLALAAGVTSCEDVPAPYQINLDVIAGQAANDSIGKYRETPHTVASAITAFNKSKTGNVWVKGYIVGYVPSGGESSTNISNTLFELPTESTQNTNIVLSSNPTESVSTNCMVIQLPAGELRDTLNLAAKTHAENLGKSVLLYGSLEKYFGGPGLKSTSYAEFNGGKFGKDPDSIQTKFEHITIKEFLAKKDTKKGYELTGVATSLDATYASFNLTEDGYKIYIYRMNDAQGKKADLSALGIEEGDTVTVTGVYLPYTDKNGNVKDEINPATFVRVKKGVKQKDFDRITIAEFLQLKDENKAYEIEGVATGLNENYASFDLTQDGAKIYVYKTVDAKGAKVSLSSLGIAEGDTVVVRGKYLGYKQNDGTIKDEINPATYVSHKKATNEKPVGECITLDFTTNTWGLPEGSANGATAAQDFTNGTYTIKVAASEGFKYYFNTTGFLMLGKQGAYLTLPVFDFVVDRIEVTGTSKASGAVAQNIYVGETAVSTKTEGAQATNTYEIAGDYQAAGNQYTLKVESAHNTQISKIVVYKAVANK